MGGVGFEFGDLRVTDAHSLVRLDIAEKHAEHGRTNLQSISASSNCLPDLVDICVCEHHPECFSEPALLALVVDKLLHHLPNYKKLLIDSPEVLVELGRDLTRQIRVFLVRLD